VEQRTTLLAGLQWKRVDSNHLTALEGTGGPPVHAVSSFTTLPPCGRLRGGTAPPCWVVLYCACQAQSR
jgi:hypothetical protein